jgi:hypothetical protein
MGVPVVTKVGYSVSTRVSDGILTAIVMPDWIAADDDRYVEIALGGESGPIRTLRNELPDLMPGAAVRPHMRDRSKRPTAQCSRSTVTQRAANRFRFSPTVLESAACVSLRTIRAVDGDCYHRPESNDGGRSLNIPRR